MGSQGRVQLNREKSMGKWMYSRKYHRLIARMQFHLAVIRVIMFTDIKRLFNKSFITQLSVVEIGLTHKQLCKNKGLLFNQKTAVGFMSGTLLEHIRTFFAIRQYNKRYKRLTAHMTNNKKQGGTK